MQIQILSVSNNTVPTKKGSYNQLEVAYKNLDRDGKVEGKKVMSFGDSKNAFDVLKDAKTNETYDVKNVKIGDFWNWVEAVKTEGGASVAGSSTQGATTAPRSNYETAEERKQRQDYIIRQSSLSTAVALLKTEKSVPTKEEVAATAEFFVSFVYNKPNLSDWNTLSDDIPE